MTATILIISGILSCSGEDVTDENPTDTTTTDTTTTDSPTTAPEVTYPQLDCDPLVPEFCGYPFPSNVYTVEDTSTPTGLRVAFGPGLLQGNQSSSWDDSDGFSAGTRILTQVPGAVGDGLPSAASFEDSLLASSPTVLIHVDSGEVVPHFAEVDVRAADDAERSLVIHPVVRLQDASRYIVGIRDVVDADGAAIAASPVFAALRDDTDSDEPSVEARRALYDDIFGHLEAAGWARSEVQQAWDFTTASDENNTAWMLHMRDEAMDLVGTGPEYTITSVDTEFDPKHIAYRIEGTVRVPLYMTANQADSLLIFGSDGRPEINADTPWADVPFEVLIPNSALKEPAAIIQYGHGLFGSRSQIGSSHFRSFLNEYNYVMMGVDLQGMSSPDATVVGLYLTLGNFNAVRRMWDRLHQGMLNSLVAMRMMKTSFAADAKFGSYIDADEAYYYGISQGGISGGVYLALSQDVERGALGVLGQPYTVLLMRSVDFTPFLEIMANTYEDPRQQQLLVALTQMPWDRLEPNGYAHRVTENPFPNTPVKEVLMRAAIGDHQVPTIGAHTMARAMGAKHVTSGLREIWGLEAVTNTTSGSFYTEYAFGLPEVPDCGVPMDLCDDPHGKVRQLEAARVQLDEFLRNGTGTNHCPDGVCSYPDMSGCEPGEDEAASEALCELP